jgi:aryl-alcohol dehydrogenase-like predicted oxidoreductase
VEYRQLGRSGLRVSVLTMGTMTFGGRGRFGQVGETALEEASAQIDTCLDAGVNLIDTANVYSAGLSEEIVGEALKGRRDQVYLATKARMTMGDGPNEAGLSRAHLIQQCEASLRRLQTDHIDLYQVHAWDGQTPLEETLGALDHLVDQGKISYVGCSNYSAWHLMKALGISERDRLPRFVSTQNFYAPAFRDLEYELVPASIDQGLGILVWSPLAGGLMSGKYRRGQPQPEGSRHLTEWGEPPVRDIEAVYDVVEALVEVGEDHGVSAAQVALAWLLRRPAVTSLIVGARTTEQLEDNLAAASLALTDEQVDRIERVSRQPLLYPYWHQLKTASDRFSAADRSLFEGRTYG